MGCHSIIDSHLSSPLSPSQWVVRLRPHYTGRIYKRRFFSAVRPTAHANPYGRKTLCVKTDLSERRNYDGKKTSQNKRFYEKTNGYGS